MIRVTNERSDSFSGLYIPEGKFAASFNSGRMLTEHKCHMLYEAGSKQQNIVESLRASCAGLKGDGLRTELLEGSDKKIYWVQFPQEHKETCLNIAAQFEMRPGSPENVQLSKEAILAPKFDHVLWFKEIRSEVETVDVLLGL